MTNLQDIIEVVEVGRRGCNDLLALGYKLLAVEPTSTGVERNGGSFWVSKSLIYVVGRPNVIGLRPMQEVLMEWGEQRRKERDENALRRAAAPDTGGAMSASLDAGRVSGRADGLQAAPGRVGG